MAYSWAMVGTPLAFVTSERFWQNQHFVWFMTPLRAVVSVVTLQARGLTLLQAALCAAAVVFAYVGVVLLLALTRAARTVPASWWLYTIGGLGLAFSAYYYNSIPRYTMVAFPLLAAIAWKVRPTTSACVGRADGIPRGRADRALPHRAGAPDGAARRPVRVAPERAQAATTVAASAIRWSLDQGGPSNARGPCSTSWVRFPRIRLASSSTLLAS